MPLQFGLLAAEMPEAGVKPRYKLPISTVILVDIDKKVQMHTVYSANCGETQSSGGRSIRKTGRSSSHTAIALALAVTVALALALVALQAATSTRHCAA